VLGGLASLAAAPAFASARAAPPVGFLALGDWGRRGDMIQRSVAQGLALTARDIDSRFVIAAGDNFYPSGVASVTDPHWRQSFEDVYTDAALQTPWCAALGNHDYRGEPQAQVAYTLLGRRWRMPGRYYWMSGAALGAPHLDLFVIDTPPLVDDANLGERVQQLCRGHWWEEQADPQIAWLRTALSRSRAPWKIVVGHHPIYSGAHGDSPVLIARVAPLLETFGVQAYVNGHDHDLQHIRRGAVDYICTGAGAAGGRVRSITGTRFCLGRPGFASFRLADQLLRLEFRDASGRVVYGADLPRKR